ncbi:helix-turn-helix domain-containing protein [Citricoccus parietis]|uniref:Helix-turn-helix domain-containing protein n=1 Tax=Citricoccus parietis TaxID=592307 RepID=A0ABV6F3K9_9MICC
MYRPTDEGIGSAILAGRQMAGILQEELSERLAEMGLNWSRVTISKVERGERSVRATELPAVAAALNMTVDDLFVPRGSGIQLRLSEALIQMLKLNDEYKTASTEYSQAFDRYRECGDRLREARTSYEALSVLHDFSNGALETEAVSWSAEALLDYWEHEIRPPLDPGDLFAALPESVSHSLEEGGLGELASAFPSVRFGEGDPESEPLIVERRGEPQS